MDNVTSHRSFASNGGQALQNALAPTSWRGPGITLRITGVCVGNFAINGRNVTLLGQPTDGTPTSTLQSAPGAGASVLRITGRSQVVIKDLRITGGTGTPIRLFGPDPLITPAGGGIYQAGGTLTLRGHTLIDHNRAWSDSQPWPGVDGENVNFGAGGGLFSTGALVQVLDDVLITQNVSVSGYFVAGGGGGLYVHSGVVRVADRVRITGNESSGAWVSDAAQLSLSGRARVDANQGGGDGDPSGGGVRNSGTLTLRDRASIDHNTGFYGGGVVNSGLVRMSGRSGIVDNTGWLGGGGLANYGRVELASPTALIGRNTTGSGDIHGGGVLNWTSTALVVGYTSGVRTNIPDDIYLYRS